MRTVACGQRCAMRCDGALVEDDHVAVGEVVLGGEGVGRVDPDAGEEGGGAERGEPAPARQAALPLATQTSRTSGYMGSR